MRSRQTACGVSRKASIRTAGWSCFLATEAVGTAAPQPPAAARQIFGARLDAAQRYAELLTGPGITRGLIGPAEASRIWERHLLNCAVVAQLVPVPCVLVDIGSGAGLPGMVLAMLLPQAEVILLEPMARRTSFLRECVTAIGLPNVVVRRGRAEQEAGRLRADVVTARAVAPLGRLAGLAAGITRPGGIVLAIKGSGAQEELDRAAASLRRLGATGATVLQVGDGLIESPTTVVRFALGAGHIGSVGREPDGGPRRTRR